MVINLMNTSIDNKSVESLKLPKQFIDDLTSSGIHSLNDLKAVLLLDFIKINSIEALTSNDWICLKKYLSVNLQISCRSVDYSFDHLFSDLQLEVRTFRALARHGIILPSDLLKMPICELLSIPNIGIKAVMEIIDRVKKYYVNITNSYEDRCGRILPETLRPEVNFIATTNIIRNVSGQIRRTEFIKEWFQVLNERQQRIISLRYGLDNEFEMTLEETSKEFNVTRERIRQIEKRSKYKLKHALAKPSLHLVIETIDKAIDDMGGIASENYLFDALCDEFSNEKLFTLGYLKLIMEVMENYFFIRTLNSWTKSNEVAEFSPNLIYQSVNLLDSEFVPLLKEEFLEKLKKTEFFNNNGNKEFLNDDFILSILNRDDRIICFDNGDIGLAKWGKNVVDNIIIALRTLGKPSHFTKITEIVNTSIDKEKHVSVRTVHSKLCLYQKLFVWVGIRGTYGLKEWGIERSLTYIDAIDTILRDIGHPLSFEEILGEFPTVRKFYDEKSINLTLGTSGRFKGFPDGTYGLVEWNEDEFLTNNYRTKRLLKEGEETLPARKSRKDVEDTINGIDAFIYNLRGIGH